ncbi:MAG: carboxy-S-adenosyl-L-methionine synthase CmoA [Gammaproteobacteria bacterium]|nr:carboxy-S-adenosyl-L-methionine synthase CmoA [Gammaproteobacteria bacterium]
MSRDNIYTTEPAGTGTFEFNEAVAEVFPDMLQRSIPGYAASIRAIRSLAHQYVQPDSHCYDLGCSLGAATMAMREGIDARGCRIIAIDNARAMVSRCREIVAEDESGIPVDVLEGDVRNADIDNASMAVMNYTLQFLPLEERQRMIGKIADGMRPGGVFVLSEKVVDEDPGIEAMLVDLHHNFKRNHAYSELEISRKRAAIENVLVPESVAVHKERMLAAGFRHVGVWLRYFNFVSLVAIR